MTDDDYTRAALDDAVSDVEPADRLGRIRARTTRATARRRRGWAVVGGAVVAAAAVVVAVAVVPSGDDGDAEVADPGPSSTTGPTTTGQPPSGSPTTDLGLPEATTPVYYVGRGGGADGAGPVLYRYFEPAGDPLELLTSTPSDPDYETWWTPGDLRSWRQSDDAIVVRVADDVTGAERLAWQQVVYTLQAVTETTLPVRFENAQGTVGTIGREAPLDVLSHVSISDPAEGNVYQGSFVARGVANGFEGNVACRLVTAEQTPVWQGATIAGWLEDRLFPWELDVDLGGVAPGTYTFTCSTDDPTGGAEGGAPGTGTFTDTRSITVR